MTMSDKYFKHDGATNPPKQRVKFCRFHTKKSVKKFTLTEFGQRMKTVQGMNLDCIEEQKKD